MSELIFQLRHGETRTVKRVARQWLRKSTRHSTVGQSTSAPPPPPLVLLSPGYCVSCRSKRRSAWRGKARGGQARRGEARSDEASRQIRNVINFVHIRNHFSITATSPRLASLAETGATYLPAYLRPVMISDNLSNRTTENQK